MEAAKSELRALVDEFEQNLVRISEPPETTAALQSLKRESVSIEGRIAESTQRLLAIIHQDDGIPSDRRESALSTTLAQVGVDLEQFRLRRRAAVNAANQALAEARRNSMQERRARLLGDETQLELARATKLRNQTAGALASDITSRLERTRDLIKSQVAESRHAIGLVKESTEALRGVGDAAMKVETAQGRARKSLMKLRWAQNWDRYILKSSFWFFGLVVCYVVYRGLTRNVFVDLGRVGFKLAKKVYGQVTAVPVVEKGETRGDVKGAETRNRNEGEVRR